MYVVCFYTNNLHIGISGCVEFFVDGELLKFCLDSCNSLQSKSSSITKNLVAQLALSGVSKGDIPNY